MEHYYLEITSGKGPDECRLLVRKLAQRLQTELARQNITAGLVSEPSDTLPKSLIFELVGKNIESIVAPWLGTIQWTSPSPFRPHCQRRNWFAGVRLFKSDPELLFDKNEVEVMTSRSGGPGGQHVNTSNTRVQLRHRPTGLVAAASEERSQHRNHALAMTRLAAQISGLNNAGKVKLELDIWRSHHELERGNPVKVFRSDEL